MVRAPSITSVLLGSRFLVPEKKKLEKVTAGLPQESGPSGEL